jgi:hypothetical protein
MRRTSVDTFMHHDLGRDVPEVSMEDSNEKLPDIYCAISQEEYDDIYGTTYTHTEEYLVRRSERSEAPER